MQITDLPTLSLKLKCSILVDVSNHHLDLVLKFQLQAEIPRQNTKERKSQWILPRFTQWRRRFFHGTHKQKFPFFSDDLSLTGPPVWQACLSNDRGALKAPILRFSTEKIQSGPSFSPLLLFLWRPGSGIECEHNLAFKTRLSILWLGRDLKGHWLLHTRLSIFWILTGSRRVKNRWFGGRFRKLRPFNVVPFFSLPTWWVRGLWQPFKISYGSFCVASSCFNYSTMGVISCD